MNQTKLIIDMMAKMKPVITRVIPVEFLRKIKQDYMKRYMARLKDENIKPLAPEKFENGVNLIGNIRLDSGLGQSMRLVAHEMEECGVPFLVYEHHIAENFSMKDTTCDYLVEDELKYSVNLLHINMHEFAIAYKQLGRKVWDYHYNIAFWLWELEEFPEEWIGCMDVLDEIWTPAEFVSESIRKRTNKPVITIPYHVEAPINEKYDRTYFGLPEDRFLFLMMYDSGSMTERKNPVGVLKAFKKAFNREEQNVGLVIKLNGNNEQDIADIRSYLDGYTNVFFMTDTLSKIEVNSLIADVDVLVSMHRAEGFGLVMAEAMLNGVPCIATNWSANTEFMNSDVACMLDYEMVELSHEIGPYKKGSKWAEPSVEQAAMYMRKLFEDREFYQKLSVDAKKYIKVRLGKERISGLIQDRLKEIGIENSIY